MEKEFFCYTSTRQEIKVFSSKTVLEMSKHLFQTVLDENCQVELLFAYARGSISKGQKKKLNALLREKKELPDVSVESILKWVSMLL
jgi:hypothetical protein